MKDAIGKFCLINGQVQPISELMRYDFVVHSLVYEVLRIEKGVILFLSDHLDRLKNTLSLASIERNVSLESVSNDLKILIVHNKIRSGAVKLLFFNYQNSLQLVFYQMQAYCPKHEEYQSGVKTISLHLERLIPNAKIWNEEFRNRTNTEIQHKEVFEAVLINKEGFVTEGSRSNIFFIKDNVLYTPPIENVLPGITRKHVLKVCQELNEEFVIQPVLFKDISSFNAAFLTGTTRILVPIRKIDEICFNVNNHLMEKLINGFNEMVIRTIDQS